jgi:hypothetical protein
MTTQELIKLASDVYPDGLVAATYEDLPAVDTGGCGDTLALFVARELSETFDEEACTEEQLFAAAKAMDKAVRELCVVRDHLLESMLGMTNHAEMWKRMRERDRKGTGE